MADYETLSRAELIRLLKCADERALPAGDDHDFTSRQNVSELLQNLEPYQYKLELQNRELRQAQEELREARNRLSNLYDFAPVGYVTLDDKGCIQEINLSGAKLLGMERAELPGKPFLLFVKNNSLPTFLDHLRRCLESDEQVTSELEIILPADKTIHAQLLSVRVPDNLHRSYLYRTAITDVTERRRAEQQVHNSLREKEVLLKEVHHRVKNNLQIISSLLKLQSGYVTDKRALELFRETQDIVRSMALLHEKLYRSPDLTSVDYAEYIKSVATNLFRSYGVNSELISLSIVVDHVSWGLDTAIPASLIINELISNSLKYAFPDGRAGEITVELHSNDLSFFTLAVSDDGIGIPGHIDVERTESLGLQLVHALTQELDGTLSLDRSKGTKFIITFTVDKQEPA